MYKKLFLDTIGLTLMICFTALIFKNFVYVNSPYLQELTVNGQDMTIFNFGLYFRMINQSFDQITILELQLPTREINGDLINNILCAFDWLYMPINVILWPIRLIAYLVHQVLVILGQLPANPFDELDQYVMVNGKNYKVPAIMVGLAIISQFCYIPYL